MAVAADMGTSLAVILNGMRLLRDPSRNHPELHTGPQPGRPVCADGCCSAEGPSR